MGAAYPFRSRNIFLTATFKPIYTQHLVCEWDDDNRNYITQENYEYLRDSYFRYARLLDKVPHHKPGKSVGESIYNLYQDKLIGEQLGVNIEFEQNKLCFLLWKTHGWGAYTLYWMDFGNSQHCGQVVMGTIPKTIKQPTSNLYKTVPSLKTITQYVKYSAVKETDSGPSCSLAEALEKQDMFINSTLAQLGSNALWKMFREGIIEHHGLYLNLTMMKVNPIGV